MSVFNYYLWLRKDGVNEITEEQGVKEKIPASPRTTVIKEEATVLEGGELIAVKKHIYKGNVYAVVLERDADDNEINELIISKKLPPIS